MFFPHILHFYRHECQYSFEESELDLNFGYTENVLMDFDRKHL